ncbi:MAG: hypothetical protein H6765_08850 [Candidatus Peribacteria bacterium]|nr:MAG: hypothetical protein H6765_08850 [Candidatus Peribacteria bacterium]
MEAPTTSVGLVGEVNCSATYLWEKISGPQSYHLSAPQASTTQLSELVPGVYVFRLSTSDQDGTIIADDITITVEAGPNQAPLVDAGPDITVQLPLQTIALA